MREILVCGIVYSTYETMKGREGNFLEFGVGIACRAHRRNGIGASHLFIGYPTPTVLSSRYARAIMGLIDSYSFKPASELAVHDTAQFWAYALVVTQKVAEIGDVDITLRVYIYLTARFPYLKGTALRRLGA